MTGQTFPLAFKASAPSSRYCGGKDGISTKGIDFCFVRACRRNFDITRGIGDRGCALWLILSGLSGGRLRLLIRSPAVAPRPQVAFPDHAVRGKYLSSVGPDRCFPYGGQGCLITALLLLRTLTAYALLLNERGNHLCLQGDRFLCPTDRGEHTGEYDIQVIRGFHGSIFWGRRSAFFSLRLLCLHPPLCMFDYPAGLIVVLF